MADDKDISAPYSTGGGGVNFETRVQAYFALLLLAKGVAPCIPPWTIEDLKTQARRFGFNTDDLIVYARNPNNRNQEAKLLAQIKHEVALTQSSTMFGEVIAAAWKDFVDPKLFNKGVDQIVLVTGPLSKTDLELIEILTWARKRNDPSTFIRDVATAKFSSENKRKKLAAVRFHLDEANGSPLSDRDVFEFARSFSLLMFDLDFGRGINLSLIQSLIKQFGEVPVAAIWAQIVNEVQEINQSGGDIVIETFSGEIQSYFTKPTVQIPDELAEVYPVPSANWRETELVLDIVKVSLLGAWSDSNQEDKNIVSILFDAPYETLTTRLQRIASMEDSPLVYKNRVWSLSDRESLWHELSPRIYPDHLELFKRACIHVLSEVDPSFDLQDDERAYATMNSVGLNHSSHLRKGLSQSLALFGSYPEELTRCDIDYVKDIPLIVLRESFQSSNWRFLATIDNLNVFFAESSPAEFLRLVNEALDSSGEPYVILFGQEGAGVFGTTYMSGLFWALELLSWSEDLFLQVVLTLGRLAEIDPGGRYNNRPANSLTEIYLPWIKNSPIPLAIKKAALEALVEQSPNVTVELLASLLPNRVTSSTGLHQPAYRRWSSTDLDKSVSRADYAEAVETFFNLLLDLTESGQASLISTVRLMGDLPRSGLQRLNNFLRAGVSLSTEESAEVWHELIKLSLKHRRFPDAVWSLPLDVLDSLDETTDRFVPQDIRYRCRRLFVADTTSLFTDADFETQDERLFALQQSAMEELLSLYSVEQIEEFASETERPRVVGLVVARTQVLDPEMAILTGNRAQLSDYSIGYWYRRYQDEEHLLDFLSENLDVSVLTKLLAYLPFEEKLWSFAESFLPRVGEDYWTGVIVDYPRSTNLRYASTRLLQNGRPLAAIACQYQLYVLGNEQLDHEHVADTLLQLLATSEEFFGNQRYYITEVLKKLQSAPAASDELVAKVEWNYLDVIENQEDLPIRLARQIEDSPDFFHQIISSLYRSKQDSSLDQADTSKLEMLLDKVRSFLVGNQADAPSAKESSAFEKKVALNSYKLLGLLKNVPGHSKEGLDSEYLISWIRKVQQLADMSGHTSAANLQIGELLIYSPAEEDLWIDQSVARELNRKESQEMRRGYSIATQNQRGAHWVDPTGNPEFEMAKVYREKAAAVENLGLRRFGETLRKIAEDYTRQGEQIVRKEGFWGESE